TFRRACVGPSRQRIDVGIAQPPVVGEMAILRVGEPGRNFARNYCRLYRLSPRTSRIIGEERCRSDFPGPRAALAILLQDREYIFVERDVCRHAHTSR